MSVESSIGSLAGERLRHRAAELLALSRRSAKALAEDLLPESLLVFRGREGRQQPLGSVRRVLSRKKAQASRPGRVALTFDDGPTPLTPRYLEVLDQLGVRATFFLIGELCAARPDLVRDIVKAGHQLGGHGYTHRRFDSLTKPELLSELVRTRELLTPNELGTALVRPPYGSVSLPSLLTAAQAGFTNVHWSLNSCDWRLQDAADIVAAFNAQPVLPGEIVLLHEGQPWTINALPDIIGSLKQAGHELVTVGELLA